MKGTEKKDPPWKDWEKKAKREGLRAPIYEVKAEVYIGEWKNDKKHGKNNSDKILFSSYHWHFCKMCHR